MKNKNAMKVLSAVLSGAIVVTSVPITASAAELESIQTEISVVDEEEAELSEDLSTDIVAGEEENESEMSSSTEATESAELEEAIEETSIAEGETVEETETTEELMTVQSTEDGFVISETGVLTEYTGSDTEIVIPEGIIEIGNSVFKDKNITSVKLPDSLKKVGDSAFCNTQITSIVLPENVNELGIFAFGYCSKLTSVEFKGTNTIKCESYSFGAFEQSNINSIIFAEGTEIISTNLFVNAGLAVGTVVTIPASVTTIEFGAFAKAENLEGVIFEGNNVKQIKDSAFLNTGLTSIELPDSLRTIGESAFEFTQLKEIRIPENVTSIADSAFADIPELTKVTLQSTNNIECKGVHVTTGIFKGCNIKDLVLPEGMKTVPANMFMGAGFTIDAEVTIPSTVTTIGSNAFYLAKNLAKVKFAGNSISTIADSAFRETAIKTIELPDNLNTIGERAFAGTGLTEITIPEQVAVIGKGAFEEIPQLTKVILLSTKKIKYSLGYHDGTFRGCTISEISLPKGMEMIPDNMFYEAGFAAGMEMTIPDSVFSIGNNAFAQSTLETIKFPISINMIGDKAIAPDVTVYAVDGSCAYQWAEKNGNPIVTSYGIIYQLNGGAVEQINPTVYETNKSIKVSDLCEPTRKGYTFEGWYTDSSYKQAFTETTRGNITLYAKWQLDTYSITYELDGGTLAKANPVSYDVTKKISLNVPTKTGYQFVGWQVGDDKDDILVSIEKGNTGDLTLTAVWEENVYIVRFNSNAKDASGTMENAVLKYTDTYTVENAGYIRAGYDFVGWNTMANGKGDTYQPGDSVTKLTAKDGEVVNLYAQWQQTGYEIVYVMNGGRNNADNPATYADKDVSLKIPTRVGYIFEGWYTDADFSGAKISKISKNYASDIYVYAKWTPNAYTITYNANGGKGNALKKTFSYEDEAVTATADTYTRAGYKFIGWNTSPKGTGKEYAAEETVGILSEKNRDNITLYAQWEMQEYTITYELEGGRNNDKNVMTYNATRDVALQNPVKEHYTFGGWYTDKTFTKESKVNKILKDRGENVTLYAQWIEDNYTVKFDKNGGKITDLPSKPVTYKYYDQIELENIGENPVREGFTFTGWNTEKDGTGKHWDENAVIEGKLVEKNKGNITLYAEWRYDKAYNISYKGYAVSVKYDEKTRKFVEDQRNEMVDDEFVAVVENGYRNPNPTVYDERSNLNLKSYNIPGKTFAGWYEDAETTKKVTQIKKTDTGEKTLYGKWIENGYVIKYDGNGAKGVILPSVQHVGCSTNVVLAGELKRDGYIFDSWNTQKNGKGDCYQAGQETKGMTDKNNATVTLYAIWIPINHKVIYNNMDGAVNAADNEDYYNIITDLSLKNPSKTGYTFAGWYEDEALTKKITKISKTRTDDVSVYAGWKENTYSIVYNTNGGTGKMEQQTGIRYSMPVKLNSNTLTRKGYIFTGWNTAAKATGAAYADEDSVMQLENRNNKTVTLYAQWKAIENPITYVNMNNADNSGNPDYYTIAENIKLKMPVKAGYTFGGWYADATFSKKSDSIAKNNMGERIFYAKWIENSYNVRFAMKGGNGKAKSLTSRKYSAAITLPEAPVKEGYLFKGWGNAPDAEVFYNAGDQIQIADIYAAAVEKSGTTPRNGQYFTLYAVWEKVNQ